MAGIQPPENLQTLRKPILVVGRCPLVPGIGDDINGTLDRINGLPLQGHFREAFANNVDFIANKENGEVVVPPSPNDTNPTNMLLGGIISLEPEIKAPRKPNFQLEVGKDGQVAYYPQDCFIKLNGTIIVKDVYSVRYFKSLFPKGSEILIQNDIGEGGKTSRGQSIFFYSSEKLLKQKMLEKINQTTHLTPIRIPSPKKVEIKDLNRAVKMDHIDQMLGPDILVADKNGKYVLVPIAEDYYEALNSRGLLPNEIRSISPRGISKIFYLPIKKKLLNTVDLLNCPTSKQRVYLGPILSQLITRFIDGKESIQDPLTQVNIFQEELIAKIESFPDRIDNKKEATLETKSTYEQLKFYEAVMKDFENWQMEAQSKLGTHTQNVYVMPNETPATHYFKGGTKCKLNIIS